MKMTFKAEWTEDAEVTVVSKDVALEDILRTFEHFLRGCGFVFKGTVDIVEDFSE